MNQEQEKLGVMVAEPPSGFDACDFYDCYRDAEALTHEHAVDAIIDFVDELTCSRGAKLMAELESNGPVTVYGWDRNVVDDGWVEAFAAQAAEDVDNSYSEEFGAPDGDEGLDRAFLEERFRPIIAEAVKKTSVWRCERTSEREYSPAEVIAVIREHRPRWLEERQP